MNQLAAIFVVPFGVVAVLVGLLVTGGLLYLVRRMLDED